MLKKFEYLNPGVKFVITKPPGFIQVHRHTHSVAFSRYEPAYVNCQSSQQGMYSCVCWLKHHSKHPFKTAARNSECSQLCEKVCVCMQCKVWVAGRHLLWGWSCQEACCLDSVYSGVALLLPCHHTLLPRASVCQTQCGLRRWLAAYRR